jgi:cytochrome b involved in lipid metabolism
MRRKYHKLFIIILAVFFLSACGTAKKPITTPVKPGLTALVVAEHNTPDDCWVIENNNIYDMTDYISQHAGGEKSITDYCGKDATTAFEAKGGTGGTHSDQARQKLSEFYIGDLAR